MDQYFIYNSEYKVLICREHGYAIQPSGIDRHLRESHFGIPLIARQELIDQSKMLELVDPALIQDPQDTPAAISGLNVVESLQCNMCPYIRKHIKQMISHCVTVHGWGKDTEPIWSEVKGQTFFYGTKRRL
jgi:hypothetical protein